MALAGVEVFAQGPVEATMTGADGRLVSTVDAVDLPDVEAAIGDPLPGAAAFETRFSRTVFATEDGSYTTTLAAGSEGELAVLLRVWDDDAIVTTVAYPPFGVSEGTVVTVEHAVPFGGAPALFVDDNGDGSVDLVIEAASVVDGDAAADRIPPVTSAEVVRITDPDDPLQGHALVELSATDDGGSGVDRIEYAILPDEQEGVHDGTPLLLVPGQSLLARAIDRAGNVEVPPLLVEIDEGTDDRELVDGSTPQFIGSARLVEPGQQHWWGFELTATTHDFALQGLQADYDLAVYDEDDQLVAATTERGTQSKQLRLDLEAGRYYALVSGHEGAYDLDSDYLLRVTRLGRGHGE